MLVKGPRPLDIVQNAGQGEGAEAFRKPKNLYHPRVAFLGWLSQVLCTRFTSDARAELEHFDKVMCRYEVESGKTLDDEDLLGVVINGLHDTEVRNHILRNSASLSSYQMELLEMARATRVLDNPAQPMDIGATQRWCYKGCKGKGKASGKGSGCKGGPGKSKGADNPRKERECHYCHKKGYINAECPKRTADEKGKKGGKGKTPRRASPRTYLNHYGQGCLVVAGMTRVDSGAGSNLFAKNFGPRASPSTKTSSNNLATVTGETLDVSTRKCSVIHAETDAGDLTDFRVKYAESSKMQFSVCCPLVGQQRLVCGPSLSCG